MIKRNCVRCNFPLRLLPEERYRTTCVRCGPDPRDSIPRREITLRRFASEVVIDPTRPDPERRQSRKVLEQKKIKRGAK